MRSDEEVRLLARAARGDEEAYARLLKMYAPALIRYLRLVTRDPGVAEDVAQETFVRAFANLERLREPGKFTQWLWKIGRCAALDAVRSSKRDASLAAESLQTMSSDRHPTLDLPADYWLEHESLLERTRQAVGDLPEPMEQLVTLRYRDQCSYQEIAARTGLNHAQVKARLARARAKLKDKLDRIAGDWMRLNDEMP